MQRKTRAHLALVAAAVIGALFGSPVWNETYQQKKITRDTKALAAQMESERVKLIAEKARRSNPASREEIVREHGFLKSGERRVEILR